LVNRFTVTAVAQNNGLIDVVVLNARESGGREAKKSYQLSVQQHATIIALRDQIAGELDSKDFKNEDGLPVDKTSAPIYAALLELQERGSLPQSDQEIGLLKRTITQENLNNPTHVAKAIIGVLDRNKLFAERVASKPRSSAEVG